MTDARRRRFDVLLVWRLDRSGRSLKHLIVTLDELAALAIAFVSLNKGTCRAQSCNAEEWPETRSEIRRLSPLIVWMSRASRTWPVKIRLRATPITQLLG